MNCLIRIVQLYLPIIIYHKSHINHILHAPVQGAAVVVAVSLVSLKYLSTMKL